MDKPTLIKKSRKAEGIGENLILGKPAFRERQRKNVKATNSESRDSWKRLVALTGLERESSYSSGKNGVLST
jgi:hypothetical protein